MDRQANNRERHDDPDAMVSENIAAAPPRDAVRWPQAELLIGAGACVGVPARWLLSVWLPTQGGFPVATLLTNLLGCLVIGLLQTLFLERRGVSPRLQLLLVVGLLGGFTTFSTFSVETVQLITAGRGDVAILYQLASLGGGLGAVLLGRALATWRR